MAVVEQQLIKRILAGDERASKLLYEQHEHYWFRICLRYGRDRQEAEDLFQVGVVKIFRVLDKYDLEADAFNGWSNKVLVNEILNHMKKYKNQPLFEEIDGAMQVQDYSENVIDRLAAKEIIQMIQQLPAGYRIVFNLYQMEGYTHRDIALELGISAGASKSQLFKARNMLKRQLEILYK